MIKSRTLTWLPHFVGCSGKENAASEDEKGHYRQPKTTCWLDRPCKPALNAQRIHGPVADLAFGVLYACLVVHQGEQTPGLRFIAQCHSFGIHIYVWKIFETAWLSSYDARLNYESNGQEKYSSARSFDTLGVSFLFFFLILVNLCFSVGFR
mgnify:FL=1